MLKDLRIENFAIIDKIDLQLQPGLITFTGETGAGKSILIDAVETLLGGRADATMIRSGCESAFVEGAFYLSPNIREPVQAILQRDDLLDDPEYVSIAREIRLTGRNIARVNGRSVNATLLREIGEYLIDIHGQSEHLSLLRVSQHLGLLDNYAGVEDLLAVYRKTYQLAMDIFHLTKRFPKEEMYALTDQIRRSSRSIGAQLLRLGQTAL